MTGKPLTVDEYLARCRPDHRACLTELRHAIAEYLPKAEECLSYAMPGFRSGTMVAGYAAFKHHCGYYPHSGSITGQMTRELAPWKTTKSGILFTPDTPLPRAIIHRLLDLRLAEIAARTPKSKGGTDD